MKTMKITALAACITMMTACETAPPPGGAAGFRLSAEDLARHEAREAQRAEELAASQAQPSGSMMYQQNEHGLFGSRSSSGVIQTTGPVQTYQTIGSMPVYPGMPVPVNPAPVYPPNERYYRHPTTGQMIPLR